VAQFILNGPANALIAALGTAWLKSLKKAALLIFLEFLTIKFQIFPAKNLQAKKLSW
jgi:hypothetical protein